MLGTTNCRYCGHNIDVAIALHNTGLPDVCDNCAIEQMAKRRDQKIIETLAMKVMGWELDNRYFVGDTRHECFLLPDGNRILRQNWNPLCNIADAWMLMEKLKQRYFCEVAMTETEDGYLHWMARFIEVLESPYRVNTYKAVEKEAPRAIGMAAYKLVA